MVSPTTVQPEDNIILAPVSNGDLVKTVAAKRSPMADQPLKTINGFTGGMSSSKAAAENPAANAENGLNTITNGIHNPSHSQAVHETVLSNGSIVEPQPEIPLETTKDTPLNGNAHNDTASPAEVKEVEQPKRIIPAPIPTFNVWKVRQEALDAKKVTEVPPVNVKPRDPTIDVNGISKSVETLVITDEPSSLDDSRRITKKSTKKTRLPPPLADQNSWPAPAEVLIKDKEKEANDSSEKRQSSDSSKREEGSSPKRGKEKWIPYTPIITHSTPLPVHGSKHRRRSEDSIAISSKERRAGEKNAAGEPMQTSTHNGRGRRASVPPTNGHGQYARRYSQSGAENGQVGNAGSNGTFRGVRRGRGRIYSGTRSSRSAHISYSTNFSQQQYFATKYPLVYDLEILKYYILQQIEYYFSIENLCKDIYLRSNMDAHGFVDISLLAGFNRVKLLTLDENLVREALLNSYIIEVSGDKARKRDGWEHWVLPNQQNKDDETIGEELCYEESATTFQEYEDHLNEAENYGSLDDENKENQEMNGNLIEYDTLSSSSSQSHSQNNDNYQSLTASKSRPQKPLRSIRPEFAHRED